MDLLLYLSDFWLFGFFYMVAPLFILWKWPNFAKEGAFIITILNNTIITLLLVILYLLTGMGMSGLFIQVVIWLFIVPINLTTIDFKQTKGLGWFWLIITNIFIYLIIYFSIIISIFIIAWLFSIITSFLF